MYRMTSLSVAAFLMACLALFCVVSADQVRCGSDGYPACNGTIQAYYEGTTCGGTPEFYCEDVVIPYGTCTLGYGAIFNNIEIDGGVCAMGKTPITHTYGRTPSDTTGNCTQTPIVYANTGAIGNCIPSRSDNSSSALLCSTTDVPRATSHNPVVYGPVILDLASSESCYAPDRCSGVVYWTTYGDDKTCSRSTESREILDDTLELDVCYDYRSGSASEASDGNVQYAYDGTVFTITQYVSGCSGDIILQSRVTLNTCYISGTSSSVIYKINLDKLPSNPSSGVVAPTGDAAGLRATSTGFLALCMFVLFLLSVSM